MMDDPQIHRALASLWDPAADAGGGGSSYRVVRGFILKTDSRHLSHEMVTVGGLIYIK